jgi:hypothetical protein
MKFSASISLPPTRRHRRFLILAVAMAVGMSGVQAAQSNNGSARANSGANEQASIDQARGLLQSAGGGLGAVEHTLNAINTAQPGTGAWFLQSGQRLAWLAASSRSRKDYASARQTGLRAIDYLLLAQNKFVLEQKLASAARALEAIGRIHAEILLDDKAANAAFALALTFDPTAPTALAVTEKTQKAEERLREKLVAGGGK